MGYTFLRTGVHFFGGRIVLSHAEENTIQEKAFRFLTHSWIDIDLTRADYFPLMLEQGPWIY